MALEASRGRLQHDQSSSFVFNREYSTTTVLLQHSTVLVRYYYNTSTLLLHNECPLGQVFPSGASVGQAGSKLLTILARQLGQFVYWGMGGQEEQVGLLGQVYPSGARGVVGKGHAGPAGQTGPVAKGIGRWTHDASECA
jgi:hypothetical protein